MLSINLDMVFQQGLGSLESLQIHNQTLCLHVGLHLDEPLMHPMYLQFLFIEGIQMLCLHLLMPHL
jgi:hypothetical protein